MGGQNLSEERLAALLKVDNVIVTLKGEVQVTVGTGAEERSVSSGKAIIGDPYQQIVRGLAYAQEVDLDFRLLKKDVENVTVSLEFLGATKDYDVFLKKESEQDLPEVSSAQYDQVGALGSKIRYDLDLERLAKTEQSFSLVVLNLPEQINFSFLDPRSGAMLTAVRFTEETSRVGLNLELSIPAKLPTELVGADITFHFLAVRRSELKKIFELREKHKGQTVPPEEIAKLKAGMVELTLIPRGVGKLDIVAPNLFKEVEQGRDVQLKFNVLNSGTLPLRNVAAALDLPLEWTGQLTPREVETIDSAAKVLIIADLKPPLDVTVGEYTVKVKATGHSGVELVEAIAKDFTVRVAKESSITGTVILVAILVLLVVGIAIASIRISRR